MRRDSKMVSALLEHGANANFPVKTWTPTRRSSEDWHFEPDILGATPYWLATRFTEPDVMRMLVKRGADPSFVLHATYVAERGFGGVDQQETATPLMAAVGVIRTAPWVEIERGEREALMLETVKLCLELAPIDVNVANTDGRTALDAARALKYQSVVDFLVEKGAKAGNPTGPATRRRRDDPIK